MKKYLVLFVSFLLIFQAGCVEKNIENKYVQQQRNYVVYNIQRLPSNLILLDTEEVRPKDFLLALFDGLVRSDESGKIMPALAESWTVSKDGITYNFKLRDHALWSNGEYIKAQDFVQFFKSILHVGFPNLYAEELSYIYGAAEYRDGKKGFEGVAIRAVSDKELEIRLNRPCSFFLNILSQPEFVLRQIEDHLDTWKSEYASIHYSGPFKIESVTDGGEVTLSKNYNYWNEENVASEKVMVYSIESSEIALAKFDASKIDILVEPPESELKRLISEEKIEENNSQNGICITFNQKTGDFTGDINFRKSIQLATDSQILFENAIGSIATAAAGYIPPGEGNILSEIKDNKEITLDERKSEAVKRIKLSKYKSNEKIRFVYLNTQENKRMCETLASNIESNLSEGEKSLIKIQCLGYDEDKLNEVIRKGEYDILKFEYTERFADPLGFLESWYSSSSFNQFGFKSADFDTVVSKASTEVDMTKKNTYLKEAQDILLTQVAVIPLLFYNPVICKKSYVQGVYLTRRGNLRLDGVNIKTPR